MGTLLQAVALGLIASLGVGAPARAQEGPVDLLSQFDIRFDGEAGDDALGLSVSAAGDVNDDGIPDAVVGAPGADGSAGRIYVLFGDPTPRTVDLSSLGDDGFQIDGEAADDIAGNSVSRAGDVNDDGFADVIIGAEHANGTLASFGGAAYVVFGKATTEAVDLSSLGSDGFAIEGGATETVGREVAGVFDVNNDGFSDVALSAPRASYNSRADSGSIYVVFGKDTSTTVDLTSLGAGGFHIDGEYENLQMSRVGAA